MQQVTDKLRWACTIEYWSKQIIFVRKRSACVYLDNWDSFIAILANSVSYNEPLKCNYLMLPILIDVWNGEMCISSIILNKRSFILLLLSQPYSVVLKCVAHVHLSLNFYPLIMVTFWIAYEREFLWLESRWCLAQNFRTTFIDFTFVWLY